MQSSGDLTDNSEGRAANMPCVGVTNLPGRLDIGRDATGVVTETQ